MTLRRALVAILAAVGMLLAACGDSGEAGSAVPSAVAPDAGLLDISAPLVGGGQADLRAYAGKPVAFWFWAPT